MANHSVSHCISGTIVYNLMHAPQISITFLIFSRISGRFVLKYHIIKRKNNLPDNFGCIHRTSDQDKHSMDYMLSPKNSNI